MGDVCLWRCLIRCYVLTSVLGVELDSVGNVEWGLLDVSHSDATGIVSSVTGLVSVGGASVEGRMAGVDVGVGRVVGVSSSLVT